MPLICFLLLTPIFINSFVVPGLSLNSNVQLFNFNSDKISLYLLLLHLLLKTEFHSIYYVLLI